MLAMLLSPPPLRPWKMQAALCLVLVGSLALAAWVSRRQTRTLRIRLSEHAETIEGLSILRPDDWTLVREDDGLLLEEAHKGASPQRKLKIRYSRSSIFMSPLEYLVRCGELQAHEASSLMDASAGPRAEVVKMINIAGWPG